MKTTLPRLFLAAAAAILLLGGIMHTAAFPKAVAAVSGSNLPAFFGNALQALWLIDSTMLFALAIAFALIAARPVIASAWLQLLLSLIPGGTAALLYYFVGGAFIPAHMLAAATILVIAAVILKMEK